jgi:hypothetical protein
MNVGNKAVYLKPGQKLCQFVLMPIMATEVVEIVNRPLYDEVTDRGEGKFGSTGTGLPPRTNYKWDMEQAIDNQKGKMPDQFPTLDEELPKKKSYPKRKGPVAADEEME